MILFHQLEGESFSLTRNYSYEVESLNLFDWLEFCLHSCFSSSTSQVSVYKSGKILSNSSTIKEIIYDRDREKLSSHSGATDLTITEHEISKD